MTRLKHSQPPVPPLDEFTPERIADWRKKTLGLPDYIGDTKRMCLRILDAIERRDAVIAEMRSRLGAAAAELQDRADRLTPDHPGYDGTDAAHPAWWRGEKAGADGTAAALQRVAERGHAGTFGGATVEAAAKAIVGIREDLAAEREKVRVLRGALQSARCELAASYEYMSDDPEESEEMLSIIDDALSATASKEET